jgi:hypothetical protein
VRVEQPAQVLFRDGLMFTKRAAGSGAPLSSASRIGAS